jgi:hypothetical protein
VLILYSGEMLYAKAAITTVMIIINRFTPNIAHRLLLMINPANDGIRQKMSRISVVIVIPNAAALLPPPVAKIQEALGSLPKLEHVFIISKD